MMKYVVLLVLLAVAVLARPFTHEEAQTLTDIAIGDWDTISENLANSPYDEVKTAYKEYLDFQQQMSGKIADYNKKMDGRKSEEQAAKDAGKISETDYLSQLQQDISQDISFMMLIQLQMNQKVNKLVAAVHKYYPEDDWFTQELLKQVNDSADKTQGLQDKADKLSQKM